MVAIITATLFMHFCLIIDPNTDSHQGTDYILGFVQPYIPLFGSFLSDAVLYISTQDPRGADVTIEIPRAASLFAPAGFPMNFTIECFETRKVKFPTDNDDLDIRVEFESDRGIHVFSTNGAKLDIVGVNDEVNSNDAFVALPCKLEEVSQGNFHTSMYKYIIFSAFPSVGGMSRFMIIPCTDGDPTNGNYHIQYTLPRGTQIYLPSLVQYETRLVQERFDLTGTVITSPYPLAVFASHECGQIPDRVEFCDHLIEQIPPDITYGTRFFVLRYAVRDFGDVIRVGSTVDNNEVTITCTTSQRDDGSFYSYTEQFQRINSGGFISYRTVLNRNEGRCKYCCIETSKPAIVMHYMLGSDLDAVVFDGIPRFGDPAMSLVPPIEQYKNDYIIVTPDDVLTTISGNQLQFRSFMGWAIPSQFFNPDNDDGDNFFVNNATFMPTDRESGGSGGYVEIYCRNGEICGYGGIGPIESGNHQVSCRAPADPNAAVYVSVYGFHREISYAYPAGFECEPIGR